jgi:hypothetical protein
MNSFIREKICIGVLLLFGHTAYARLFPYQSLRPILEHVIENDDGTYTASFGYVSDNRTPVSVVVGESNHFSPLPANQGQPTVFEPGRHVGVFTVNFSSGNQVWTLDGLTATAYSNRRPLCTFLPLSATHVAPASLTLKVNANDPDGAVAYV